MAEFVQQSIEEMLPELEQMQRVGLFTAHECRSILRKRKAFEYKLRRRTKQKSDFLQYIQYEMNVLALVKKRRKKIGYKFKRVEIDVAIVQRIHQLFRLVCYRFQEDVKLWLSHIDFCKKRNEKASIGKLYTRMLQVHAKTPGLWVAAAVWEVEGAQSMETARSLLQRGLRFNPDSRHLWQEYFRMELLNAEKLRKRRDILGIKGVKDDTEAVSDVVLDGKIAEIVYNKATEALPDDAPFHINLIHIAREFPFTGSLQDTMYKNLEFHHSEKEAAWDAAARRHLNNVPEVTAKNERVRLELSQEAACCTVYDKAVKALNTVCMWEVYVKFCVERLGSASSKKHKLKCISRCLTVLQSAQENGCVSEDMYLNWLSLLENTGQADLALTVCQAASERHPASVQVWLRFLELLITLKDDVKYQETLTRAFKAVPEKDSLPLWELAIQWTVVHEPEKTEELFERGVAGCREVSVRVKILYLKWCLLQQGIKQTRRLYTTLSTSQPLSLEFFQEYITMENSQSEPKMKFLRRAYEDACRELGAQEPDLWLSYLKLELTHASGTPENAGTLHWRALKALDDTHTEAFMTKYTLMQAGH